MGRAPGGVQSGSVHLLFWEHPPSRGANARRACHAARRRGPGSGGAHPVLHPSPGRGEGRPGERGGRRRARRRWAAARDELSPAGCCPQVASDAARGPRPRRQPPGPFRASLRICPGWVSSRAGPPPTQAAGSAEASSPSPDPSLPASPARPPRGGLHSERPRAARPDPTRPKQASQPASRRGGATVTKPAASARSATAATGFPPPRQVRAPPPPPPRPIEAPD